MVFSLLQKWATSATPEPFREFIPYVSPSSLHVVYVDEVLKKALDIGKGYFQGRTGTVLTSLFDSEKSTVFSEFLKRENIDFTSEKVAGIDVSALSAEDRKAIGDRLLGLYFSMTHHSALFLLDLRLKHFQWDAATKTLTYSPPPLYFSPSEDFRSGIMALYRGFYFSDPAATSEGIHLYAWKMKMKESFRERMEVLIRTHFGAGDQSQVSFSIQHFKSSFHEIFEEAKRNGSKFHPELTFVGVMLVTLYLSLEALGETHDVRKIYIEALK
jgi:hypothetical protein